MCLWFRKGESFIMKSNNTQSKTTHGSGSIYFVESRQRYAGAVILTINGKKKRKTVYGKTKSEVRDKILDLQIKAKTGQIIEKDSTTFYQLANNIIGEQLALNEIKQSSYERKVETLKKLEPIYDTAIQDITLEQIKRFFMTQMYYSQSYINKAYQLLNLVLNEAKNKGLINENPMRSFKRPKSKQEQVKVRGLTVEEQKRLLQVLKTEPIKYSEQMMLSMFTGMRMGEINALEVRDIDFKNKNIRIRKTVSRGENGETIISNRTKTYAGMRKIPMNEEVAAFLKTCIHGRKSGLIFSNDGKIITTNLVNNIYSRALEKYDILDESVYGKVDLHSLRHTFACRAIEGNCPPKVLQIVLGHKDISVTLNTYTDVFDHYLNDKIAITDKYFKDLKLSII